MQSKFPMDSDPGYVYFTMAIFQNTFGLTDLRKPEFKLTVTVKEIETEEQDEEGEEIN